jgi:superfamily I DNA/RNA helicase
MAHILPDTLPQFMPTEVLKALPDSYYIWHHLAPWKPDVPDFLMITQDGKVLLLKVSPSVPRDGLPEAQLMLLDDNQPKLGEKETVALSSFVNSIDLPENTPINILILFANISQNDLINNISDETNWVGKEILQTNADTAWESFFPDQPMDRMILEKIRHHFTPEILIPEDMTVRSNHPLREKAGLKDYLLDYNQEAAVKADLELASEGQKVSTDFKLNIINGVAGSGKTLILLYRLRLLYHLYPNKKFLVITHNRPISHDMQGKFSQLEGIMPENIEWRTFNSWCYHHWPKEPAWKEPLSVVKREALIKEIWEIVFRETTITESMLQSEIDWIKDQSPINRSTYLSIDRRGRGFSLGTNQRNLMWKAIVQYQKTLNEREIIDWGDISQTLWKFIEKGQIELPKYDFIMIDEAQFFAPIWFEIIQKALREQNSHLFIVADPTQGFLSRRTTWKSLGFNVRGKTINLHHSYRTTREIMQFATMFYRERLGHESDEDVLVPDMLNMPNGVIPQVISLPSSQDEISRVTNEVVEFLENGFPRKHLLLLHANGAGVQSLINSINTKLGKDVAMDPKDTFPGNYVRVTTLNAGAGLESPIVFLVGLRELFEQEQSLRLSDDEREEIVREVTRKVYMAATRAGQRLVFTYVGDLPQVIKNLFQK